MALTKVSGQVVKTNTDLTVGVLTATTATFTTVSVAGTITYDDVTNVDSVGLITARSGVNITSGGLIVTGISTVSAGTTSAPSISPSGDTNTGIFFPSADTIAFGEGGAEAARFDSSGRLLVGTSSARTNLFNASASAQLQIEGTDGNNSAVLIARNSNDTAPPNFHLAKSRGTSVGSNTVVQNNDLIGRITFTGSDGTEFVDAAFIEASVDGTPGANDMPGRLVFSTTADGASTPTERARITSAGLFGIGCTPVTDLQVNKSSDVSFALSNSSSVTSGNRASISCFNSSNSTVGLIRFGAVTDNVGTEIQFHTRPAAGSLTQSMTLDSSGRLGIGTNSPSYILHVNKSGDVATDVAFTNSGGTAIIGVDNSSGNGILNGAGANDLTIRAIGSTGISFGSGYSAPSMRLTSTGRLGIGTTSPATSLHLLGANTAARGQLSVAGNAADPRITLYRDSAFIGAMFGDTTNGVSIAAETGYSITFNPGGTSEKARFDSSGRLLVGTSSSSNLYAIGGANFAPKVQIQGTDPIELGVQRTDGPPYVHIANGQSGLASGNDVGFISFNGKDINNLLVQAAQISAAVDGTPGANDMPGRLVFSTTADGASSPTERMRIKSDGQTYWVADTPSTTSYGTSIGRAGLPGLFETARNAGATNSVANFHGNLGSAVVFGDGDLENTNGRYTAFSDIKLKQNIEDSASQWDDLKAIRIRKYELKTNPDRKHIGVVAQELEQVCPGLVIERENTDGETYKSVAYSVLYTKAVKALQEAMERIEQLEAKVAALESA